MRKYFKMTAAIAAALIAFNGSVTALPADNTVKTLPAAAADDTGDDWLHAVGSRLYDKNGNEVWLTGANWFGLNCTENVPHGLYARDVDDMLQDVANHGINIIRFPISTELLLSWMDGEPLPVSSIQASYNPPTDVVGEDGTVTKAGTYGNINKDFVKEDGKTEKNSMEIFDIIMQKCKKYGIKALIDVHSPASHNSGHNYNLWYYEPTADDADNMATGHFSGEQITWDDWVDSITWLAEKYKNDDTIIAYDLKNEPHGKRLYSGSECPASMAKWDNSTDKNNWRYSAEECAKSILGVNPNALILIEGIEQSPMTEKGITWDDPDQFNPEPGQEKWYGAWWGGNLRGVKDLPVLPESSQIVYSPHDYGPSVYKQSWFCNADGTAKNFTTETLLDEYWRDTWAYINEDDIAPLLIGEWGGHMDGAENQKWMGLLRDYMIKHHINHTFWCLNPNSGDTGGLLDTQFKNWDDAKYGLFEESLWQTLSSGKYIGLDHQTALGENGLSLTDFYSNYASTEGSNLDGGTKGSGHTEPVTDPTTDPTTDGPTGLWGDADCNGEVKMNDVVLVMQSIANQDKYGLTGSDSEHITADGQKLANVVDPSNTGLTVQDALQIQKFLLEMITDLTPNAK
ncbi:MAG: glycoside hydrolase family 5 protein [Ruminococcus sp.]|nr:glycoside hydrolase family 5 protein [Ruminococcus sp.]